MFFMENAAPAPRHCGSRGAGKTLRRGRQGRCPARGGLCLRAKRAVLRFRTACSAVPRGLYCGLKQAVSGRLCAPFAGRRRREGSVSGCGPAACTMRRKLWFLRPATPGGAWMRPSAGRLSCFFATQRPARAPRRGSAAGCAPARKPMPMRAKKAAGVAEFGFFALTLQP